MQRDRVRKFVDSICIVSLFQGTLKQISQAQPQPNARARHAWVGAFYVRAFLRSVEVPLYRGGRPAPELRRGGCAGRKAPGRDCTSAHHGRDADAEAPTGSAACGGRSPGRQRGASARTHAQCQGRCGLPRHTRHVRHEDRHATAQRAAVDQRDHGTADQGPGVPEHRRRDALRAGRDPAPGGGQPRSDLYPRPGRFDGRFLSRRRA